MKVVKIVEQEDGSAIVELSMTDDERQMILELGFNTMIMDGIGLMMHDKLKQMDKKLKNDAWEAKNKEQTDDE